ncbi:hypothetical protein A2960_06270 [Candidatus Gottesmanbacteria bacterium RIFCSPLOWO2_01_FULL_39_12b]|uniref:Nucleotidyl transferase AbiEii/AbiGii toxin family protein n=1 Tax=Candidatus Gottesmanbacteria bacterium RIFCSPLOWO2_01_FULL_39_12b TaxID=1798388 RepID=A0A1F6AP37_9BACT|nr:MAG: hypothetical protein A2960_06270 [Candidatus Gottesmanbacteria bacterium RIFCSPLOWO2_01_FULL_39_12b]
MITRDQITFLSKKYKINETVVFREYLQILFLSVLYSFPKSKDIFFKGGTAIHLIYKAPRFSEDLDFTVNSKEKDFLSFIFQIFNRLTKEYELEFKERKTISGKRFLLTAKPVIFPYKTFINLDFSFREKIIEPNKSIIETDYPVLFTSFLYHLSKEEVFAEKIRAVMTRKKGRDLYDLWYLTTQGVKANDAMAREKIKYYGLKNIDNKKIIERISEFSQNDFILDLRPFVPVNQREKLGSLFVYVKDYLRTKLL